MDNHGMYTPFFQWHLMYEAAANNIQTDVIHVHLDFNKAFDIIPHDKLLVKLFSIGVTGNL